MIDHPAGMTDGEKILASLGYRHFPNPMGATGRAYQKFLLSHDDQRLDVTWTNHMSPSSPVIVWEADIYDGSHSFSVLTKIYTMSDKKITEDFVKRIESFLTVVGMFSIMTKI